MTQRTDLEPHFAGTFHVADDPGVAVNGYVSVTGGGWTQTRFWVGEGPGGKLFLVDADIDWPEDD